MKLYHGTNKGNLSVLKPSYGRFGIAVYLTDSPLFARNFGSKLIEVEMDEDISEFIYDDLIKFCPDLNISEEEGFTDLERFVNTRVVAIKYRDGTTEYVVYGEVDKLSYL